MIKYIAIIGMLVLLGGWGFNSEGSEVVSKETVQEVGAQAKEVVVVAATEATEALEFTFDKIEGYFGKVQEVVEKYGGDVANLGLNVLRIDAASHLISPLILFLVLLCFVKYVLRYIRHIHSLGYENPWVFLQAFPIGYGISLSFQISELANIWSWVGIFYPELYAVYKFLL